VRLMNVYHASKTHTNPLCGSIFGSLKVFYVSNKAKLVMNTTLHCLLEIETTHSCVLTGFYCTLYVKKIIY
jgi:hypothetical protein